MCALLCPSFSFLFCPFAECRRSCHYSRTIVFWMRKLKYHKPELPLLFHHARSLSDSGLSIMPY
jgi:hypothetical protein